jgi:hypothetical protein
MINCMSEYDLIRCIKIRAHKRKVERINALAKVKPYNNTRYNSYIIKGRIYT